MWSLGEMDITRCYEHRFAGSSPVGTTKFGWIAQMDSALVS